MKTLDEIKNRLLALGFKTQVLERYNEPHRFFHTTQHLLEIFEDITEYQQMELTEDEFKQLVANGTVISDNHFLATIYHDAIYNPKQNDNEERSAELFVQEAKAANFNPEQTQIVKQFILDTKQHVASSEEAKIFIESDLDIRYRDFNRLMEYEMQIFKEYQYVDYRTYLPKRLEVITSLNIISEEGSGFYEYVRNRKPLIGVFCGSFNPFHKGHYNVLQKAEKIFDKVIIAFGANPDKSERTWPIPATIQNRQIEHYNGLLTDFIQTLEQDVVVIRGLRNSTDFQYEQNQYRYIQELMPGIKIINIFCDKEFEHISSSGIRTLEKFNKHQNYLLE